MPQRALKACPGCQQPIPGHLRRCARCEASRQRKVDERRSSAPKRGYGRAWQRARRGYLAKHPLCVECQREGREELATVVDHIKPHRGDRSLFWDRSNWQGLCASHHSRKTAAEDAGFGNRPKGGVR